MIPTLFFKVLSRNLKKQVLFHDLFWAFQLYWKKNFRNSLYSKYCQENICTKSNQIYLNESISSFDNFEPPELPYFQQWSSTFCFIKNVCSTPHSIHTDLALIFASVFVRWCLLKHCSEKKFIKLQKDVVVDSIW